VKNGMWGFRAVAIAIIIGLMANSISFASFGADSSTILAQKSYGLSLIPFSVQQVKIWENATVPNGYAWGAAGILNNSTAAIKVTSIIVNGKWVPHQNWYVDINQTELNPVFKWSYIVTSMNGTGFLKESAALSPNACFPSPATVRIDFDGAGPKYALCLKQASTSVQLAPNHEMIVYFKVPDGVILPSNIGSHIKVRITTSISTSTYSISKSVAVNDLNNFNLRFWLHTAQPYYSTSLNIFANNLKAGDYMMIGGNNTNPLIALQDTQLAKPLFKPGVNVLSDRIYYTITGITSSVPSLPTGYDYIVYDYEKGGDTPEFTTNETQSIIYFDEANSAVQQYNKNTGSHAKLMVAISYPPIRWAQPPWNWGLAAKHMSQIMVMMSGYYSSPCLANCASSVISQIRHESPTTVNEVQLSMARDRGTPQQIASAIYVLQGVGVKNTLVFYDDWQDLYLQQLFTLLSY
jgi:hypothetical protein